MQLKNLSAKHWVLGVIGLLALLYIFSPMFYMGDYDMGVTSTRQMMPWSSGESYGEMATSKMAAPSVAPMPPRDEYLGSDTSVTERKVVRNGSLSLLVEEADALVASVREIALTQQGFVEAVNVYESDAGAKNGSLTLRVPAADFDQALGAVKALAIRVEQEQVSSSDVTEQYIDLEARLKNAKSEEEQYRTILRQATRIEDILSITRQITETRTRIDQYQGQLNYLSKQVDMSTLSITFREEAAPSQVSTDWRPMSVIKQSVKALFQGVINLANIIIAFVIWLPLLALWLWVIYAVVRLVAKAVPWIRRKFSK